MAQLVQDGTISKDIFIPEYFLTLENLSSGEYNLVIGNNEFEISSKIVEL